MLLQEVNGLIVSDAFEWLCNVAFQRSVSRSKVSKAWEHGSKHLEEGLLRKLLASQVIHHVSVGVLSIHHPELSQVTACF